MENNYVITKQVILDNLESLKYELRDIMKIN